MSIETEVKAVETKMEAVAAEVVAEVKKVVEEVKPAVVRLKQEITTEEKLAIREIENEYLKAQMQINALSQTTQNAQKKFTSTVEALAKKYVINPAELVFDNITLEFKKL
jgi:hypothetical protein